MFSWSSFSYIIHLYLYENNRNKDIDDSDLGTMMMTPVDNVDNDDCAWYLPISSYPLLHCQLLYWSCGRNSPLVTIVHPSLPRPFRLIPRTSPPALISYTNQNYNNDWLVLIDEWTGSQDIHLHDKKLLVHFTYFVLTINIDHSVTVLYFIFETIPHHSQFITGFRIQYKWSILLISVIGNILPIIFSHTFFISSSITNLKRIRLTKFHFNISFLILSYYLTNKQSVV